MGSSGGGSSSSSTNLVLSGFAYNNFVDTIKSDQTREQYKRCLVRFMRFLNITDIGNLMVLTAGSEGQDSKALQQKIIDDDWWSFLVESNVNRNIDVNKETNAK